MTVSNLTDLEDVIGETLRHVMLKDRTTRPTDDERHDLTDRFAKDTVNLILTYLVNNPEVLDQPYTGNDFAISSRLN